MNVQQFVAKYIETSSDGHDFMPADIKEDTPLSDRADWVQDNIEDVISDDDVEFYQLNRREIIVLALKYINED